MENKIKILFIVTDRGAEDKIVKALGKQINFAHVLHGHGTANSEVMAVLGLGETGKTVITAAVTAENVKPVFKILSEKFRFDSAGKGIAFTVPVGSVGGMVALQTLYGKRFK